MPRRARLALPNVGAGHPKSGATIPQAFQTPDWKELRLDIDPANEPDILGTMLEMSAVAGRASMQFIPRTTSNTCTPMKSRRLSKNFCGS